MSEAILRRLIEGESISRREMKEIFGRLMDGEIAPPLQAGILVALAAKGESIDEITGAVEAMRGRVVRVEHPFDDLVDTCGTGGDGLSTFNISSLAAIVAAAAGARVAKHGNRAVSSACGSADLFEALGVDLEDSAEGAAATLSRTGIAFLHAPAFHPAMRVVMPVRRALGVRTLFNLIGPLTNPAGVRRQVVGVYALDRVEPVARVLAELGSEHALVVHGHDGQDEISVTGPTRVAEVRAGEIEVYDLDPGQLGVATAAMEELRGGAPERNVAVARRLLAGEEGPLADAVCLSAGAALFVAGRVDDLGEGLALSRETLAEGRASAKLDEMRGTT